MCTIPHSCQVSGAAANLTEANDGDRIMFIAALLTPL